MKSINKTIGFIGAGNMAEAIIGALIESKVVADSMILACDISNDRLNYMASKFNINITDDINHLFNKSDVVILAVKPQAMNGVLEKITITSVEDRKLIISIAAGLKIETFEKSFYSAINSTEKAKLPIVRVMPNTPSLVLEGMSGICSNDITNQEDILIAKTILESMGKVVEVDESKMDAVTAVSGSGPAYFFYFVESMIEEAETLGLSNEEATILAVTTMKGAAKLLEKSEDSPADLRRKVTSPGGTTEAAINVFEESEVKKTIKSAIAAAAKRSEELC